MNFRLVQRQPLSFHLSLEAAHSFTLEEPSGLKEKGGQRGWEMLLFLLTVL